MADQDCLTEHVISNYYCAETHGLYLQMYVRTLFTQA